MLYTLGISSIEEAFTGENIALSSRQSLIARKEKFPGNKSRGILIILIL